MNGNGQTIHESLAGVGKKVLALIRDPETPISEWTEPSLIVLRAVEVAQASKCDIICGFSSQQVSPILSISDWAYRDKPFVGTPYDSSVVAALMELAGSIVDEGISHERLFAPVGACIRFTDNELVCKMARKKGSIAQRELDRRAGEEC